MGKCSGRGDAEGAATLLNAAPGMSQHMLSPNLQRRGSDTGRSTSTRQSFARDVSPPLTQQNREDDAAEEEAVKAEQVQASPLQLEGSTQVVVPAA